MARPIWPTIVSSHLRPLQAGYIKHIALTTTNLRLRGNTQREVRMTEVKTPRDRIIGSAERRRMIPFSDMHICRLERQGGFPKRIKLGDHRVGWDLDEVVAWIEARKALRGRS
jgi:prophage regulatory protein